MFNNATDNDQTNTQTTGPQGDVTSHLNDEFFVRTFDDLNLKEELARGISSYGFTRPSSIQSRGLEPCIRGSDVIAQAQSGTGKTATFVISALQRLDIDNTVPCKTQIMVLAPTRELALQSAQVFMDIGQYMGIKILTLIGGTVVTDDISSLQSTGAHVIVGTPGRILHLIGNQSLSCNNIKMFIIDEADEMLKIGFRDQIHQLFKSLPSEVQVVLLSATMPESVIDVTKTFMRNPLTIYVKKEQLTLQGIKQFYFVAEDRNAKVDVVIDLLGHVNIPQMVVFCNTQRDATILCNVLEGNQFKVSILHAGKTHTERCDIMKRFRNQEIRTLITTNLISRGIDVQSVALVVNFYLPRDQPTYIHRIGRSGRYGRKGIAINLIVQDDYQKIKDLEAFYNTEISELPSNFEEYFNSS